MIPAFFALVGMHWFGLPFVVSLAFAMLVSLLVLGLAFKKLVIEPMLPHGTLPIVMATIALGLLMKESVKVFYSAEAQPFPSLFSDAPINVMGAVISAQDIANLVISLLVVAALQLFLNRTRTGRAMQATAQNPGVAEILGVNVKRMVLYTFLINAALAAVASFLISPIYLAKFSNGESIGLIAFIAAIVGGFNQVRGALVGGLLIGVIEAFIVGYVDFLGSVMLFPVMLVILLVVLLLRPSGLFGSERVERV
jgi:branched-chain amino acid transport system permease protein